MYNNSLQAEHLLKLSKQHFPAIATVAGGPHFGALGRSSLARIGELDFVIEGEGEIGLSSLISFLEGRAVVSEVPNLCYRAKSEIKCNRRAPLLDLAQLPEMWTTLGDALDLRRYPATIPEDATRRGICIEAGRGCPYTCSFCAPAVFWERKYRVKPVTKIVEEMRFLSEVFGYDSFLLVHDLLTVDKRYVADLCSTLKDAELPIEWMANSRTDLDLSDLLPTMREAGCWKLFFGVESASERIQHQIDKKLQTKQTLATVEALARNGIDSTCSFVIGFPDESRSELSATIRLGARLKLVGTETVQFHRLRLWPPAPLTKSGIESEFDLESFKLEYPFVTVREEDVDAIRSAPDFFAGYFAPTSTAGHGIELAQVELFFQQAVGLAPITISVLGSLLGERLVEYFYKSITELGPVDRYAIDWISGDLLRYWEAINPFIRHMARQAAGVSNWAAMLLDNVLSYEFTRLQVVAANNWQIEGASVAAEGCVAFPIEVDISQILNRIRYDLPLDEELLHPTHVILMRSPQGYVVAFQGGAPTTTES
jgi:hypothetical protein